LIIDPRAMSCYATPSCVGGSPLTSRRLVVQTLIVVVVVPAAACTEREVERMTPWLGVAGGGGCSAGPKYWATKPGDAPDSGL